MSTVGILIDVGLVVFLLAFALVGLKKGFFDSILSILGTLGALAVAVFTAKPILSFIDGMFNFSKIVGGMFSKLFNSIEALKVEVSASTYSAKVEEFASSSVSGLSGWVKDVLSSVFKKITYTGSNVTTLAEIASEIFGHLVALIIIGIVVFILIKLIVRMISKLYDGVTLEREKSSFDRILGFIFGLAKGALFATIIVGVVAIIPLNGDQSNKLTEAVNETHLLKFPYYQLQKYEQSKLEDGINWDEVIKPILDSTDSNKASGSNDSSQSSSSSSDGTTTSSETPSSDTPATSSPSNP
jgi:uncharacterized membrane protein required for colicin V production